MKMLSEIFYAIVGAVAVLILTRLCKLFLSMISKHTGSWQINVYLDKDIECADETQTISIVEMKGYHNMVSGKIHRISPDTEKDKRWTLTGLFTGENFLAIFNTSDKIGVGSNGVFFFRFNKTQNRFVGQYLKYDHNSHQIIKKNATIERLELDKR
jgi:hypothetical protein